jgi:hypothetical protein
MPEQHNSRDRDDRQLAEQFQTDAERCRPAFSEALHRRTMVAVRAAEKGELPPSIADRRRHWLRVAAAVAASLLILAAGVWRLSGRRSPAAPADQQIAAGGTGQRSRPVLAVTAPATSAVQNYSLDDLNRGAGLAVKLVVDRLPLDVPTEDWGLPSTE